MKTSQESARLPDLYCLNECDKYCRPSKRPAGVDWPTSIARDTTVDVVSMGSIVSLGVEEPPQFSLAGAGEDRQCTSSSKTNGEIEMNSMKAAAAGCAVVLCASGCVSMKDRTDLADNGSLRAQSMSIIARPSEYGIDELGDASGEATSTTILGFIHTGDSDETSFSIFGAKSSDPLEGTAAYRAASAKGGDAFYQVTAHTTTTGFLGIFSTKSVRVTGKALKLKYLGVLSEERADRLKHASKEAGPRP